MDRQTDEEEVITTSQPAHTDKIIKNYKEIQLINVDIINYLSMYHHKSIYHILKPYFLIRNCHFHIKYFHYDNKHKNMCIWNTNAP